MISNIPPQPLNLLVDEKHLEPQVHQIWFEAGRVSRESTVGHALFAGKV